MERISKICKGFPSVIQQSTDRHMQRGNSEAGERTVMRGIRGKGALYLHRVRKSVCPHSKMGKPHNKWLLGRVPKVVFKW